MAISKSSQKKPFFSIIIPTLNEEKYLPKLLACLQKQSYKNFEVFVVDGHSKDKTQEIAKNYQKILNLSLLNSKKRNVSYQRNLGAKKAKGKYLIFIDADTVFPLNTLKKTYQYITLSKESVLCPSFSFSNKNVFYQVFAFITNLFFYLNNLLKMNFAIGQYLIIKHSLFKQLKGYNQKLALSEEHNLIKRARSLGQDLKYVKSIKIVISSRRIEKEGWLVFLSKYFYFIVLEKIKGPIYHQPPLDYPMGGGHYA